MPKDFKKAIEGDGDREAAKGISRLEISRLFFSEQEIKKNDRIVKLCCRVASRSNFNVRYLSAGRIIFYALKQNTF
ncbi:hypothetical protein D3C85_1639980 [compost metagenome]